MLNFSFFIKSASKLPQQRLQIGFTQNNPIQPSQPTPSNVSQQETSIIFPDIPSGNIQRPPKTSTNSNNNLPPNSSDSFDDLAKRFEDLKKK